MSGKRHIAACLSAWATFCYLAPAIAKQSRSAPVPVSAARFVPQSGRTLLVIGQDLGSIDSYARECEQCPVPGGVTTYLGFYNLLNPQRQFGGLGEDAHGKPAPDADWGAGVSSAARTAQRYPQSALVLGLDISNGDEPDRLRALIDGAHDDKILRLARFCQTLNRPVFLRIGYEFDGIWNRGYEDHANYIAAFRRIVDTMRAAGASNVAFVWQASASPLDDVLEDGRRERIEEWYPGAQYVDWVGLSWFLPPNERQSIGKVAVPTQLVLANEVLAFARAASKPVMIAESTPQGYDLAALSVANISPLWDGRAGDDARQLDAKEIWRTWYAPLFDFIATNRDVVRALAYINARWDDQAMWATPYASGYWGDSRIQASETIEINWTRELQRPVWQHGGPGLCAALGSPNQCEARTTQ